MSVPGPQTPDERHYLSLRTQVSIGIAVFFLLALVLYFSVVHPAIRQHVTKLEREKIQLYASSAALQIEHDLNAAFDEIQSIAGLSAVRDFSSTNLASALGLLHSINSTYRGFAVSDNSGEILGRSAGEPWLGSAALRAAYETGQTRLVDGADADSSNVTIFVTTPIFDSGNKNPVAMLTGSMAIDSGHRIFRAVLRPPVPAQWQVSISTHAGRTLAHSGDPAQVGPEPAEARDHAEWHHASAQVNKADWIIRVKSPGHLISREVAGATWPITWAFLGSSLGLVLLGLLAVRRFVQPLATLTSALYRFGVEGKAIPVAPGGSGEIAGAIEAFNRVATERREVEEALRASEARFRRIFESDMIGILFWNKEGRITDANHAFLNLVGYSKEDVAAGRMSRETMTPPEHFSRLEQALKEIQTGGSCAPFEKEFIGKDGRRIPVVLGGARIDPGSNEGVCFVLDVSERRHAEEIQESLRRLAAQMTASLTMEELGAILARECRKLFGYDAFFFDLVDEPKGGHTTLHAEDTPFGATEPVKLHSPRLQFSKPVQPLFQGEPILLNRSGDPAQSDLRPWGIETRRSRSLMFTPIRWEGKCIGVISVQSYSPRKYERRELNLLQLIADQCGPALARVQSETALQESRQFVQHIAELTPNVLYVFDLELSRNIFVNREIGLSLGYTAEEAATLGGRIARELMHPQDQPRFAEHLDRVRELPDEAVVEFEYRMRHKNGQWRWYHNRDTVFARNEAGQVKQVIGTATDITLRKNVEKEIRALNENLEQRVRERTAQFEAANKELEAFSYSVSHDLRAPLRHVSGFASMLRSLPSLAKDPPALHYTTAIAEAARRMGNLIDDLLVFSRMGRTEMHQTRVRLSELVEQVRTELHAAGSDREIEWCVGTLPEVSGDPAMLRLVFQNLIENALKYTGPQPKPRIEVGFEESPLELTVFVRDNGVGFDMQYSDKLFGVFQRLHRDEEFEGTGIGLANVRRIISRHGGRTWAEGKVNEGASIYFTLPL